MEKLLRLLNSISIMIPIIFIPLLVAFLYSAGLHYYHSFLTYFGIPYDLFNIDLREMLYFGGVVISVATMKMLSYLSMMLMAVISAVLLLAWLTSKFNISWLKQNANKDIPLSVKDKQIMGICFGFLGIILIINLIFLLFSGMLILSSNKGEETGKKLQAEYLHTFHLIQEKKTINDNLLFSFKLTNKKTREIGYLLAGNRDLIAIYNKNGELVIVKMANVDEIKKYS